MAIADVELLLAAHHHPAHAIDRDRALDDVPGLPAIAASVHGERAADAARHPGEKLRAFEVIQGGEARDLRARHARFRVDEAALEARPQLRRMHQDDGAAPAAVAHE